MTKQEYKHTTVRLPGPLAAQALEDMRARGFTSFSAFMTQCVRGELKGTEMRALEARMQQGQEKLLQHLKDVGKTQDILFALIMAQTRTLLRQTMTDEQAERVIQRLLADVAHEAQGTVPSRAPVAAAYAEEEDLPEFLQEEERQ